MKILYILGAYKPDMSANGVCSDNVIRQLLEDGHQVTVLSNGATGYPETRTEDGLEIVTVRLRFFLRLCEKSRNLSKTNPKLSKLLQSMALIINKIQLLITSPIWPVVSPITVRRFKKKAISLQSEKDFDAVISVYTPFDAMLAGKAVKQKYPKVKYFPYFLDSLSGGYGPRVFSKEKIIKTGLKIEKEIFEIADRVILMESSREHHLRYNSEFEDKISFLDIPMLTPFEKANEELMENKVKKLLYVGSISSAIRNPDPLIKILSEIADSNVVCEFIGNIDCPERFSDLKKLYGERLKFTGFISHNLISKKIVSADVLLNIGNSNSSMVPSKIFEYMSYGKPILSTYVIDNEPSLKYLQKYPLSFTVDGRNGIVPTEEIEDFIFNENNAEISNKILEEAFYRNTPKAFVKEITEI